jgi:hypothetical protein
MVKAAAKRAATRCEAVLLEEMTAVGVRFAHDHPDAPRAVWAAVSA